MNQRVTAIHDSSLPAMLVRRAAEMGDEPVAYYRHEGTYRPVSWRDFESAVLDMARYLMARGIAPGDRVALYANNGWHWWMADMAAMAAGAVSVPIHTTNSAEETAFVLRHAGVRACFVGDAELAARLASVRDRCPDVTTVVSLGQAPGDGLTGLADARRIGRHHRSGEDLQTRIRRIGRGDDATYMYTSGTTGDPKGVMLTHGNILSNVEQVQREVAQYLTPNDRFLSFMPLSHSLERTCGYYFPLMAGCPVYFAESIATILQDLQTVRPTILISAPRIYEKIHAGIMQRVGAASPLKRGLFAAAMGLAARNVPYRCHDRPRRGLFAMAYGVADGLVLRTLKAAMGLDRLSFAISGGGPLSVSDARFFLGLDLRILEGYGLTETAPVASFNRPWLIKPGTVGAPVADTTVRIDEATGEIMIRGPQVTRGYFDNSAATAEAFTTDGFFRTGDIGMIDADGYLAITGRIKDIIVTAGGKNISPQNLENSIRESPYIEQVAVIGDRRKYLAALVIPSFDAVRRWGASQGLAALPTAELAAHEAVRSLIAREIAAALVSYSRVEQIKRFALLDEEWSQATGELTPSLKVKRRVIEERYRDRIEELYRE